MHKGDLEQGPNWRLVVNPVPANRRAQWGHRCHQSQVTLGRRGPTNHHANQDRLPPHACKLLGRCGGRGGGKTIATLTSLWNVKPKKAERIGIGVAKRLALVQADIWATRGAAGDLSELEHLLAVKETCTKSAIGKLVDGLAQQGHLLIRHHKGLRCTACSVYRADRQLSFWNQHNAYADVSACGKSVFPTARAFATSAPIGRQETSDEESGQGVANLISKCEAVLVTLSAPVGGLSQGDRFSLPVSPKPESNVAHARQFCVYASPSPSR